MDIENVDILSEEKLMSIYVAITLSIDKFVHPLAGGVNIR